MLTRENVIAQIKQMPEHFSIDDLLEKLLFLYKLEVALDQSKKDHVQSHESVKEKHKKWFQ